MDQNTQAMTQDTASGKHREPGKDKTFYFEHGATMIRLRAPKKPSNKTMKALKSMIEAVKNKHL